MDIVAAWTATVEAFREVFSWKTGGRSQDDNSLRARAEQMGKDYAKAVVDGDVARANQLYLALRELRDQARAKR